MNTIIPDVMIYVIAIISTIVLLIDLRIIAIINIIDKIKGRFRIAKIFLHLHPGYFPKIKKKKNFDNQEK